VADHGRDGQAADTEDVVTVPPQWQARGFSGRYHRAITVPGELAQRWREHAPCLLRDQAWLLLEVRDVGEPTDENGNVLGTLVRLDAAALVDLTATATGRRPSPGAYR